MPMCCRGKSALVRLLSGVVFLGGILAFSRTASADTPVQPDKGKFLISIQEADAGTDSFSLTPESAESDVDFALAGQKGKFHNTVTLKAGRMTGFVTDAGPAGKISVTVAGAKSHLKVEKILDKDVTLPEPIYPYGIFGPHLYAYLVAAYDKVKGGPQKFNVVMVQGVGPSGLATATLVLTALPGKPVTVGGVVIPVLRYSLGFPTPVGNLDAELLTDADGRVLLWSIPSQKISAVRDGYQ